ncbi:MAG: ATPase, T2SS/T4P/T4SS family [Reyranella sp.]|uniref:ATPase, T2SS/T4P/T4SS family n=1 Tax=Reyranella sp. TaxID=1929291 RepID=UPI002731BD3A|nr:ATPase, T2SS/T4P/T4SS family [Reyranella sp.]MDP1960958.1 ATPase, T2SS/T4P/T4SS family [Reyranella sp.]MDP2375578.1 ATPase, T2SS/T4P/T4SS family [Reyranella sp.]
MTALSGGDKLEDKPSPVNSVPERPSTPEGEAPSGPRPLDRIFPLPGDTTRARQMQETWQAFCGGMAGGVRAALDKSRSPPEIAYAIGELVHNSFRTRGVTLTSFELRRLVAEVLDLQSRPAERLVVFTAEPPATASSWTGDEAAASAVDVPDSVFRGPPSALVDLPVRDAASFDGVLAAVIAKARARLAGGLDSRDDRAAARGAIDAALGEILRGRADALSADAHERLALQALSEICGLGLIDRLWADRSVRAVVVNRPDAVFVERNGVLEPAPEQFRDRDHLLDIVARLTRLPPSGIAEFRLRDGSEGTLVVPPAAPSGPVLILRRGEPGAATFERLIASEMLDRAIADLLRIAVRCRLDVVIAGPQGSGKTALLAAIAHDLGDAARVVTVARHREFRWPSPSKVELVAPSERAGTASFTALLAAGMRLRPDLLLVDSVRPSELAALGKALSRGERATIAAVSDTEAGVLEGHADLSIRLGRTRDGLFRVVLVKDSSGARLFVHENGRFQRGTAQPAFAGLVRDAGYGEALSTALR